MGTRAQSAAADDRPTKCLFIRTAKFAFRGPFNRPRADRLRLSPVTVYHPRIRHIVRNTRTKLCNSLLRVRIEIEIRTIEMRVVITRDRRVRTRERSRCTGPGRRTNSLVGRDNTTVGQ